MTLWIPSRKPIILTKPDDGLIVHYRFGEGDGVPLDSTGKTTLNSVGCSWVSSPTGLYVAAGGIETDYWEINETIFHLINDFTVIYWLQQRTLNTGANDISVFGSGTGGRGSTYTTSCAWSMYTDESTTPDSFKFTVGDGVSRQTISLSLNDDMASGDDWMFAATYTRVGGASNNKCSSFAAKVGGSGIAYGENSTRNLMQQVSTHKIRSKNDPPSNVEMSHYAWDWKFYNKVLNQQQLTDIFNAGIPT